MKTWEFVMTGGPCAGKTTAMTILEQELTQKGYKVIVVAEGATELISSGITPAEIGVEKFQRLIIGYQLLKESNARIAASLMNKDTVILYDRGVLDSKAYISYECFKEILSEKSLTELEVRDNYDAVFHLVTAAKGAEEFYTLENNSARTETAEQAREIDDRTINAWIGHQHLRVIDNSTSFTEKVDRLLEEVYSAMGVPIPLEIERKFLIKRPSEQILNQIENMVQLDIFQAYLNSDDPSIEKRIRQRGNKNVFSYFYTEKKVISNLVRQETEYRISEKEYISLLTKTNRSVSKKRYCFVFENQYLELDVYPDMAEQAILEIELTDQSKKISFPSWIEVIEEVTDKPEYKNANRAK